MVCLNAEMDLEKEINDEIMKLLAYRGPVKCDPDAPLKMLGEAAEEVWNDMELVDQEKLVNDSYRFVIDLLGGSK